MTETLVPNGDADDYIREGLIQIESVANQLPFVPEQHVPYRGRVDILAGRAGMSSAVEDWADFYRRRPRVS